MNILIFYLSILLVIFLDQSLGDTETIHWEWRDLVCQTGDKGKFSCRHSQITFTIRCEFLFSRNETPTDIELFNSLIRRN
uniref:Uncharacterized protein n=1 Tax=Meloidogyne hapla TaxID=6305 RepID=A0A1I8AXJ9_MELHA